MFVAVDVKVHIISDSSGASIALPGLFTPFGLVDILVRYFEQYHAMSIKWMSARRLAVKLFLQYTSVNPLESDSKTIFMKFAKALQLGTFDPVTGDDQSGLCWHARRASTAQGIVTGLTDFFDWMEQSGYSSRHPNPVVVGSSMDRLLVEAAYQHRRNSAFLGHSWAMNSTSSGQNRHMPRNTVIRNNNSRDVEFPTFPENRFEELLFKGFKVKGQHSYRDMLITLLMHGAGFRVSEPFHLFCGDVVSDSEKSDLARVFIHHPSEGSVPPGEIDGNRVGNRAAYLLSRWGLVPRNRILGTAHAGWKGGMHHKVNGAKFFNAFWFAPEFGKLFLELWKPYMMQVARLDRQHPYAFISLVGDTAGDMLHMKTYRAAHAAAVERIGMVPAKHLGTSPHGHRYAYAQRLKLADVPALTVKECMHHKRIESQETYTRPPSHVVFAQLRAACERLDAAGQRGGLATDGFRQQGWR